MARARTIRDPLWGNIRVEPEAAAILDAPAFQRLRGVKQLGFGHLVYPGGVHTRFLHALGVYHLTSRAIARLEARPIFSGLTAEERECVPLVRLAALLHDIGHYAFSHAMEELGPESLPVHHEAMSSRFLQAPGIADTLAAHGDDAADTISSLIEGASGHPLQGLVSGSLDLDKIDYLRRDSLFCGVPYGEVDVDRLIDALTLARESAADPLEIAVTEKGLSALETLLFAKYQMFRNVYWHHAVRAATVTFRRLVETALAAGVLQAEELAGPTDEELLATVGHRLEVLEAGEGAPPDATSAVGRIARLLTALRHRRLPKRVVELSGDSLPAAAADWIADRPDLVRSLEDRLCREWGVEPGLVVVDYPVYRDMLQLRLLLVRNDGEVQRLTSRGEKGLIDLPRLSRSLHHAARVFRVFAFEDPGVRDAAPLLQWIEASPEEVEAKLAGGAPLY